MAKKAKNEQKPDQDSNASALETPNFAEPVDGNDQEHIPVAQIQKSESTPTYPIESIVIMKDFFEFQRAYSSYFKPQLSSVAKDKKIKEVK